MTTEQERFKELARLVLVHVLKLTQVYESSEETDAADTGKPFAYWVQGYGFYMLKLHQLPMTPFRPCEDWGSMGIVVDEMKAKGKRLRLTEYTDGWYSGFASLAINASEWQAQQIEAAPLAVTISALMDAGVEIPPRLLNGGDQS